LVFLDETGANTKRARRYGRAFRSHRLIAKVPHGHRKTTTFVVGLRFDDYVAPLEVDGPMNGNVFLADVQQHFSLKLRSQDVVIMNNLAAHKVAGVHATIDDANAQLVFLPPSSPDFNPIELAFAKLTSLLRRGGKRTEHQLEANIGSLLDKFCNDECCNYVDTAAIRYANAKNALSRALISGSDHNPADTPLGHTRALRTRAEKSRML